MSNRASEVIEHLDAAVAAAERANMSASETMGMLFYYAHNIAQRAREADLPHWKARRVPSGSMLTDGAHPLAESNHQPVDSVG